MGERWVDDRLVFATEMAACSTGATKRLHDLRQSVGTALIRRGRPKMVSGILGHPMAEDHHAAILALPWASASTG